jgi:hypothetical protein
MLGGKYCCHGGYKGNLQEPRAIVLASNEQLSRCPMCCWSVLLLHHHAQHTLNQYRHLCAPMSPSSLCFVGQMQTLVHLGSSQCCTAGCHAVELNLGVISHPPGDTPREGSLHSPSLALSLLPSISVLPHKYDSTPAQAHPHRTARPLSRAPEQVRAAAAAMAGHVGGQLALLGEAAIGARISVWWPLDEAWYNGQVCACAHALERCGRGAEQSLRDGSMCDASTPESARHAVGCMPTSTRVGGHWPAPG